MFEKRCQAVKDLPKDLESFERFLREVETSESKRILGIGATEKFNFFEYQTDLVEKESLVLKEAPTGANDETWQNFIFPELESHDLVDRAKILLKDGWGSKMQSVVLLRKQAPSPTKLPLPAPGDPGKAPGDAGKAPGNAGKVPGEAGKAPGNIGTTPAPGDQQPVLGTISGEGFVCTIREDSDGRVYFVADADIDADGANGQNGGPAAYRTDDKGTELLAHGGMKLVAGKVVCAQSWARDIVILGPDNQPQVFKGFIIASKTWYRHRGKAKNDPEAYVDAETVPYIVVPPLIVQRVVGVVRGCRARVTYKGKSVDCVVADLGPQKKIGELSIAAARAVGINHCPRKGGTEKPEVTYELWPGQAAPGYELQPS